MAIIFQRGKRGIWWIKYYTGRRQVCRSLKTTNARSAQAKLAKTEYELSIGQAQMSRLPLAEFLEGYCRHQRATKTYKSYKNDISRLRVIFGPACELLKPLAPGSPHDLRRKAKPARDKFVDCHIEARLLEDVTTEFLNRWFSSRMEQQRWSAKTFNNYRQILHKMFSYAIRHHGFVSQDRRFPNPAAGIERQREPAPEIIFLKLSQIDEQLQVLEDCPVLYAMVATAIYAGLRRGEVVMLTHEDIDFANRLIRVRAKTINGQNWQPKTKRNRAVPISEALYAILSRYQPPANSEWFFASPKGHRYDVDNFSQDLAKINKESGLPWSCGDFRHTFGSQLAQKGESLYKISTLMGNSPEICRRHYAALIPEEMRDTVEFGQSKTLNADPLKGLSHALVERLLQELARRQRHVNQTPRPALRLAK